MSGWRHPVLAPSTEPDMERCEMGTQSEEEREKTLSSTLHTLVSFMGIRICKDPILNENKKGMRILHNLFISV